MTVERDDAIPTGDLVRRMLSYGVYESDDAWFEPQWARRGLEAWQACSDPGAMMSLVVWVDVRAAVRAACACARAVLAAVPDGEVDPRAAIEAAEAWCDGADVRGPLADAAADAAQVAEALSDTLADAEDADAAAGQSATADRAAEHARLRAAEHAARAAGHAARAALAAAGVERMRVHSAEAPDTVAEAVRQGLDDVAKAVEDAAQSATGAIVSAAHEPFVEPAVLSVLVTIGVRAPEALDEPPAPAVLAARADLAAIVRSACACPTLAQLVAFHRSEGEPIAFIVGHLIHGRLVPPAWLARHAADGTLAQLWQTGSSARWLLQLLQFAGDRQRLVRASYACARLVLRDLPEAATHALEVAERWTEGLATASELRATVADLGTLREHGAPTGDGAVDQARAAAHAASQVAAIALFDDREPSGNLIATVFAFVDELVAARARDGHVEREDEEDDWAYDVAIERQERHWGRALADVVRANVACPELGTILQRLDERHLLFAAPQA